MSEDFLDSSPIIRRGVSRGASPPYEKHQPGIWETISSYIQGNSPEEEYVYHAPQPTYRQPTYRSPPQPTPQPTYRPIPDLAEPVELDTSADLAEPVELDTSADLAEPVELDTPPIFTDNEIQEIEEIYSNIKATIIELQGIGLNNEIEKLRKLQQQIADNAENKSGMIATLSKWEKWQKGYVEWQAKQSTNLNPELQAIYDEILESSRLLEQLGETIPELDALKIRFNAALEKNGDLSEVLKTWDSLTYFELLRKSCAGEEGGGVFIVAPNKANCLKILGVSKSATKGQIKKAYVKLAQKHHPDKGGNKEMFAVIGTAKDVLLL